MTIPCVPVALAHWLGFFTRDCKRVNFRSEPATGSLRQRGALWGTAMALAAAWCALDARSCSAQSSGSAATGPASGQSSGSSEPQSSSQALLFVQDPTVRRNPIERAPLIAIVEFEASTAVTCQIEVDDGERQWFQPVPEQEAQRYAVAVVGLRPDRSHSIRVRAQDQSGAQQLSAPLEFHTDPLPDSFPPLRTLMARPDLMEPGVTLFAVNLWSNSTSMLDYGYIVALDEVGEVVWYCNTGDRIADLRINKAGHLVYQHGNYRYAYEIDLLGRDHRRWVATNLTILPDQRSIPVEVDTIHHDLVELDSGNLLTLATELRNFREYPTSEFDPDAPWSPAYVVCDRVIEFDPNTGNIVDQLHLTNVLDRRRFGYMALSGFWKDKYKDYIPLTESARDWSHANALIYLPEENAIIVSFRHLDCLMKIDWASKKIVWILGDPDGWGEAWQKYLLKPVGPLEWAFHQHSPQITPRGTLLMYDNGNYRARPFDRATLAPQNRSRVVEFAVDEQAMTVRQIYEYDGGEVERFYCPFYCEADWLPKTGNILITDGGHIETEDGTPHDDVPGDRQWARIFEITRGPNPQKVFEVVCASDLGSQYGWSIYRSIRRPNLWEGLELIAPSEDSDGDLFVREPHVKRPDPLNANFQ